MKKKLIVLVLGIVCIIFGVIITFLVGKEKEKQYSIMVDTSSKTGDTINNSYYNYYSSELATDYIKGYDLTTKNKVYFSYPISLKNTYFSEYAKKMEQEDFELEIKQELNVSLEKRLEEITDCYESNGYTAFNYSESKKIKIGSYDAGYVKMEALANSDIDIAFPDKDYSECFLLYIDMNDRTLFLDYRVYNKKFSDSFLSELASSIKIENGTAKYLSSTIEGDKIVGSVFQISYSDGTKYNVNYKFPVDKYKEREDIKNNYSQVIFCNNNNLEVRFKIVSVKTSVGAIAFLTSITENSYVKNKELYDVLSYNEEEFKYLDRNYHKIIIKYKDLQDNLTYNYVQLITKIDDTTAISITYINKDEITNDNILDFLNYEVKEY